jgi:hypothetical protein
MSAENKHFYEFGPFRIDPEERQLLKIWPLNFKGIEGLWLRLSPPSWAEMGEADAFILACNFSALCDSHQ